MPIPFDQPALRSFPTVRSLSDPLKPLVDAIKDIKPGITSSDIDELVTVIRLVAGRIRDFKDALTLDVTQLKDKSEENAIRIANVIGTKFDLTIDASELVDVLIDNPVIRIAQVPDGILDNALFTFTDYRNLVVNGDGIVSDLSSYAGLWVVPVPPRPALPDQTKLMVWDGSTDAVSVAHNEVVFYYGHLDGFVFLEISDHSSGSEKDGVVKMSPSFDIGGRHFRWFFLDGPNSFTYLLCEFVVGLSFQGAGVASAWLAVGYSNNATRPRVFPFSNLATGPLLANFISRYATVQNLPVPFTGIP